MSQIFIWKCCKPLEQDIYPTHFSFSLHISGNYLCRVVQILGKQWDVGMNEVRNKCLVHATTVRTVGSSPSL